MILLSLKMSDHFDDRRDSTFQSPNCVDTLLSSSFRMRKYPFYRSRMHIVISSLETKPFLLSAYFQLTPSPTRRLQPYFEIRNTQSYSPRQVLLWKHILWSWNWKVHEFPCGWIIGRELALHNGLRSSSPPNIEHHNIEDYGRWVSTFLKELRVELPNILGQGVFLDLFERRTILGLLPV